MISVQFEGHRFHVSEKDLNLKSTVYDRQVKYAIARYLGVRPERFHGYVVDRNNAGVLDVYYERRPRLVAG
jgi:hypothetical protein